MDDDLVSVIISCYNSGTYLKDAIESVLKQEHSNLELIFVNDGSTDNSLTIAQGIKATDNRIKIFSKPNGGLNSARNFGASKISPVSKAILFFDADDVLDKNMVRKLFKRLQDDQSIGAAYCDFNRIDEQGNLLVKVINNKRLVPANKWFKELGSDYPFTPFFSIYAWTVMAEAFTLIRKDLFFKYGGWDEVNFPKGNTYGESIPLFGQIALQHTVAFVNEPLYYYRQHSNQITAASFNKKLIQTKINNLLTNLEFEDSTCKYVLRNFIKIGTYRLPLYNYINGSMKHQIRHKPILAIKNLFTKVTFYIYSLFI